MAVSDHFQFHYGKHCHIIPDQVSNQTNSKQGVPECWSMHRHLTYNVKFHPFWKHTTLTMIHLCQHKTDLIFVKNPAMTLHRFFTQYKPKWFKLREVSSTTVGFAELAFANEQMSRFARQYSTIGFALLCGKVQLALRHFCHFLCLLRHLSNHHLHTCRKYSN